MTQILNEAKNGIQLLDTLPLDYNLPKHAETAESDRESGFNRFSSISVNESYNIEKDINTTLYRVGYRHNNINANWRWKVVAWFLRKAQSFIPKDDVDKEAEKSFDFQGFFDTVKSNYKQLDEPSQHMLDQYQTMIEDARAAGQEALVEHLLDQCQIVKWESELLNAGFDRFVNEKEMVELLRNNPSRMLHLTPVKNFGRPIPHDVLELKKKADALKVFDNYAVMHTSKLEEDVKETKEEAERRKDPILFGLIRESRKMYFIGDWVDDHCDLTLEELAKMSPDAVNTLSGDTIDNNLIQSE